MVGIYFVGRHGVSSTGPLILLAGMVFREHAEKKEFLVDRHGLSCTRGFILSVGNVFGEQAYNNGLSLRGVRGGGHPPGHLRRVFSGFC